jgi:hypothetical protein
MHQPRSRPGLRALLAFAALLAASPALAIGSFSPDVFKFAPVVQDDHQDEGAGWQTATARLKFVDTRPEVPKIWACTVTISVPLRTVALGRISPDYAAEAAADIATDASETVMHSQNEWLTAPYCKAFKDEMNRLFAVRYSGLGARVTSP